MRFTLTRQEPEPGGPKLAAAGALTLLAAGGLLAAPHPASWSNRANSAHEHYAYPARIVLPASRPETADAAAPGTRIAPLADLESPPAVEPDVSAAVAAASPAPAAARSDRRAKVPGVIPLNYSLAGGAAAGDAIEVEKPVTIGGSDAGRIALRIDGNARVYALGRRLAAIIASESGADAVPEGLGEDFVSLERLRALGLDVRYDAIRDRLVIDPPA